MFETSENVITFNWKGQSPCGTAMNLFHSGRYIQDITDAIATSGSSISQVTLLSIAVVVQIHISGTSKKYNGCNLTSLTYIFGSVYL
jgi:hypothetical protein